MRALELKAALLPMAFRVFPRVLTLRRQLGVPNSDLPCDPGHSALSLLTWEAGTFGQHPAGPLDDSRQSGWMSGMVPAYRKGHPPEDAGNRSGERMLHFLWVLGSILPAETCSQEGPHLGRRFAVLQGSQDVPPLGSSSPPSRSVGRDTWPAREAGAASTWWKQQGWVHMPGPWASLLRREPPSETGPSLTNTLGAGSWAPRVPPFTRCQIAAEPWVSCTPGVWG